MYVHGGLVNKEIGFHITIDLTGLSAPGSIFLKIFGEPVSGGMKVIFLVKHDG